MQDYEIINLIHHAHEVSWHPTLIAAAAGATPNEGGYLLNGLLARAEREPAFKPLLSLLSAACLEQMKHVPKSIEKQVHKHVAKVLPPRTVTQAQALASAGILAIPFLEPLLQNYKHSHQTRSLCLRTLSLIGGEAALKVLETYASTLRNDREWDNTHYIPYELLRAQAGFDPQEYQQRVLGPPMETTEVLTHNGKLSLQGLPPLPELHTVILKSCQGTLKDLLKPFATSPNLRTLKLLYTPKSVKNLNDLILIPHLQELELHYCSAITDVSALSHLPKLKRLKLDGMNPQALKGFQNITTLEALRTYRCFEKDLESLEHLTALRELSLSYERDLVDTRALGLLPNLEILELEQCSSVSIAEALNEVPNLKRLTLSALTEQQVQDLRNCPELEHLEHLVLSSCDSLEELNDLTSLVCLTNLKTLQIQFCRSLKRMSFLHAPPNLQQVQISYCDNLQQIDGLQSSNHLETVQIHFCDALRTVSAQSFSTHLRTLQLSSCKNLRGVHDLQKLVQLETLDLSNCWDLEQVDELQGLRNLETLDLSTFRYAQSLRELTALPRLTTLYVPQTCRQEEIEALVAMPTIRHIQQTNIGIWKQSYEKAQ